MANGTVFVYNATNQALQVTLNNVVCATQDPATAVAGKSYTPSVVSYTRTADTTPGQAVFGTNNTFWAKFSGTDIDQYTIKIDPRIWSLSYDLELYVTFSGIILAYQGLVIQQQFQSVPKEMVKLLEAADRPGASKNHHAHA